MQHDDGLRPVPTTIGHDRTTRPRRARTALVLLTVIVATVAALAPEAAGARPIRVGRSGRASRRALLDPVASAGPDQSAHPLATVTLDGSGSLASDTATFTWSQTAGPTVTLSDAHDEMPTFVAPVGPVSLTFELAVSEGATPSTDQVTISVGPLADHYSDAEFVTVQYQDFLGRPPTASELQAKVDLLASGALTRLQLVEDLLVDPVFTQPLEGAVEAYEVAFGRTPDRDGLRWWVAQRRHGASVASLADRLVDSHEYATHDDLLSDTQYVQTVYEDVLGRPADPSGLAYWTNQLADPATPSRTRYCPASCLRTRRHRRRRVGLTIAYGREGRAHLMPLILLQHADVAMLHSVPPYALLVAETNQWGSSPDSFLPLLLQSASYGGAHGW